jgi:hypothetical protein
MTAPDLPNDRIVGSIMNLQGIVVDQWHRDGGTSTHPRRSFTPRRTYATGVWLLERDNRRGANSSQPVRKPKLSAKQQAELRRMHGSGEYTIADLAELFSVSRPTVYRSLQRRTAPVP